MKFETVLITFVLSITWSEGYVANVNPMLARRQSTTDRPDVDYKMGRQTLAEPSNGRHSVMASSNNDEGLIFYPSSLSSAQKTARPQEMQNRLFRDEAAPRSFPTNPTSGNEKTREHLSRFSNGYPFERDDDEDRPIWSS